MPLSPTFNGSFPNACKVARSPLRSTCSRANRASSRFCDALEWQICAQVSYVDMARWRRVATGGSEKDYGAISIGPGKAAASSGTSESKSTSKGELGEKSLFPSHLSPAAPARPRAKDLSIGTPASGGDFDSPVSQAPRKREEA